MMASRTDRDVPEKFPARAPRRIDNLSWFYEERRGLCIVAETHIHVGEHPRVVTRQVTVSWKALCTAVDRYRKAKAKRKRK